MKVRDKIEIMDKVVESRKVMSAEDIFDNDYKGLLHAISGIIS